MTIEEIEALRPRKAVLYLRVSSKKQTETAVDIDKDGNSIATQRDICGQKAVAVNADIVEEFVEPGVSAQTIEKRPVFQALLKFLQEHRDVDYVIVYARSRAFRNFTDAAITRRHLDKLGVRLLSAREDFGEGTYAEAMEAVTDIMNQVQNDGRPRIDEPSDSSVSGKACLREQAASDAQRSVLRRIRRLQGRCLSGTSRADYRARPF